MEKESASEKRKARRWPLLVRAAKDGDWIYRAALVLTDIGLGIDVGLGIICLYLLILEVSACV